MRATTLAPFGCVAVAVAAATALGAWGATPPGAEAAPAQAEPDAGGAELWIADCAVCHGIDGTGTDLGPSLVGAGPALVHYMLSTGRMPIDDPDEELHRSPPAYPPEVIEELVNYVEVLVPGGPDIPELGPLDAADLGEGGELYRLNCAPCHAWSGGGGGMLDREAPSIHAATPLQVAEAIRTGPGTMPEFGPNAVAHDQLDAVVAYAQYLDDPRDPGGLPLWHLGPVTEGTIAWVVGTGALLVSARLIGKAR